MQSHGLPLSTAFLSSLAKTLAEQIAHPKDLSDMLDKVFSDFHILMAFGSLDVLAKVSHTGILYNIKCSS